MKIFTIILFIISFNSVAYSLANHFELSTLYNWEVHYGELPFSIDSVNHKEESEVQLGKIEDILSESRK